MTRTPPASVLSLSLFTLAVACQRPSSATNHPLPLRKLDGPPIARTFWLAHNDAEVLVSATLGHEIRLLAQQPTPGSALPYREVVMFAINGATFCRHTLPWSEQHACEPPAKANAHADPYKFKGEVLGFAKLTYTSLRDVAVEQIRVVPGDWPKGMLLAHADPEDFPYDPTNLVASHNADHNVRTIGVKDVDGDGELEIIATVHLHKYELVSPYSVHISHWGGRLLVLRDDLTRQLDIPLDFYTSTGDDDAVPAGATHRLNFSYAIEPAAVTAQWCEFSALLYDTLSECTIELICPQPTVRARWTYDPRTDTYLDGVREQLREPIDEADPTWAEQCPDDEDEDWDDEDWDDE